MLVYPSGLFPIRDLSDPSEHCPGNYLEGKDETGRQKRLNSSIVRHGDPFKLSP